MNDNCTAFETAFRKAKHILIVTHVTPDGDAVGSSAGLAHIALHCGCDVRILLPGGLPEMFSWLSLPVPVVGNLDALTDWTPDLLLFADCGDEMRPGFGLAAIAGGGDWPERSWTNVVTANIDHHVSNTCFAMVNWVEPQRAATGELVGLLAESLGLELSGPLGQALYLALASDTGNFSYSNTSAESLAMASRIVAAGLNIAAFTEAYENNWSLERMHLWGRLLGAIALHANGAVASVIVRKRWLDDYGLSKDDLEGFASSLRRIRGVKVSLFVREDGPTLSKVSLRSMGDVDVQTVATRFGGGGHAAAAGAELAMEPDTAETAVLAAIAELLES